MTDVAGDRVRVGDDTVRGVGLDRETRCAHHGSAHDVVAIALPCCGTFYACFRCHDALADHGREPWPSVGATGEAVLCGACGERLSMRGYLGRLGSDPACPACGAAFNPGCLSHRGQYVARG